MLDQENQDGNLESEGNNDAEMLSKMVNLTEIELPEAKYLLENPANLPFAGKMPIPNSVFTSELLS